MDELMVGVRPLPWKEEEKGRWVGGRVGGRADVVVVIGEVEGAGVVNEDEEEEDVRTARV
jgi:hypothetical protein